MKKLDLAGRAIASQLEEDKDREELAWLGAALIQALERIRDGGGPSCTHCECDDHTNPDCCANVKDYFCPNCIAGQVLEAAGIVDPAKARHTSSTGTESLGS